MTRELRENELSREGWAWIGASVVGAVTVAVDWPVLGSLYSVHPAVAMVAALSLGAALALAVRWVDAGIGLAAASLALTTVVTCPAAGAAPLAWPWSVMALIATSLLLLLIGRRVSWQ